ncbi:2-dehydropantoate 2-reductase [Sphingomonas sabuli]|uniref:2-dehydropantoate 2-reductase n=1 Tax=Sphingomonas sabuli TaxID=2764186 RepID=A0A7G9L1I0_9SPHN|nr:2-dehydropantoate 2-reductase [Sphingomonas sabuli]QNM82479.1 2-dehydropantoate 2-reductase [Sphingomonas sabuli]
MRIAVLGAGSIGCFVGGCWSAKGIDTVLIGRERIGGDLAAHGLSLSDYTGWTAHPEVEFTTDPGALAGADVIALTVKSAATRDAALQIARHGSPDALVISFQNGISNFDVLRDTLGKEFEVVRGMVPFNVAYLGEGRFHKGVAGTLHAEDHPRVRILAARIGDGPAAILPAAGMTAIAWGKLLINLNNAVSALSGLPLLEQLQQRDYRRVTAASQREGLRLLKAAGIRPAKVGAVGPALLPYVLAAPDWLFKGVFLKAWKIDARARSSMADDLAAGRRTEVDYLNGELVALAERIGRDAPVNRRIVELVRAAEAGAKPYDSAGLRRAVTA